MLSERNTIHRSSLCIAVLGFIGCALTAWLVYDAMPHIPDERTYLFQAKLFAAGLVTTPTTSLWPLAWIVYVLDFKGRLFSLYPPGFSMLLALGELAGSAWLVNPVLAASAAFLLFIFASRFWGQEIALWSSVFLLTSPMYLLLGGCFMSHMAVMCLFLAGYVFIQSASITTAYSPWVLSGLAMGFAFSTRAYTTVLIIPGFLALVWFLFYDRKLKFLIPRLAAWSAGCAAGGSLFFAYNYLTAGSIFANLYTIYWPVNRPSLGLDAGVGGFLNVLRRGLMHAQWDLWDLMQFGTALPVAGFIPLLGLLLVPCVVLSRGDRVKLAIMVLPLLGMIVGFLFFHTAGRGDFGPRYYSEGLPFLWMLAAWGLVRMRKLTSAVPYVLPAVFALLVLYGFFTVTWPFLRQRQGLHAVSRQTVNLIERHSVQDAVVFVAPQPPELFASITWSQPPTLDGSIVYLRDKDPQDRMRILEKVGRRNAYLLTSFQELQRIR